MGRYPPRTGVASRERTRAEQRKRERIWWLTDVIVNGVWEKALTPQEIERFMVELAHLTGAADFV